MHSTVVKYRDWVITCHARALELNGGRVLYEATAVLEKFTAPPTDPVKAAREDNLRRIYGARGIFETDDLAKDAAIAAARRAIDLLG